MILCSHAISYRYQMNSSRMVLWGIGALVAIIASGVIGYITIEG